MHTVSDITLYPHAELNLTSNPTFQGLMNSVAVKTRSKWFEIGVQLGFTPDKLNALDKQHRGDSNLIFADIFSTWEKQPRNMPFTWSTVIDVLKSPLVGEITLAQNIQESTLSHTG